MDAQERAIAAVANATAEEMRAMSEKALALGRDTAFTGEQAAEGIKALADAGRATPISVAEQFRAAADAGRAFARAVKAAREFEEMLSMPQVIISNDKTGEQYEIDSADFRRGKHYLDPKSGDMLSFEEAGFKIVSHPNGEPYTGPLNDPPKAEKE